MSTTTFPAYVGKRLNVPESSLPQLYPAPASARWVEVIGRLGRREVLGYVGQVTVSGKRVDAVLVLCSCGRYDVTGAQRLCDHPTSMCRSCASRLHGGFNLRRPKPRTVRMAAA